VARGRGRRRRHRRRDGGWFGSLRRVGWFVGACCVLSSCSSRRMASGSLHGTTLVLKRMQV
jgi:hypothetical protein